MRRRLHEVLRDLAAAPAHPALGALNAPSEAAGTLAHGAGPPVRPLEGTGMAVVIPIASRRSLVESGTGAGPSLVGHLLLGGKSGLFFAFFDMDRRSQQPGPGELFRTSARSDFECPLRVPWRFYDANRNHIDLFDGSDFRCS
jgi:hypothetical protein